LGSKFATGSNLRVYFNHVVDQAVDHVADHVVDHVVDHVADHAVDHAADHAVDIDGRGIDDACSKRLALSVPDTGARRHPVVPPVESLEFGVEGLAHSTTEFKKREEKDIRQGEAVAADELFAVYLPVKPFQSFLSMKFQIVGSLGECAHSIFEKTMTLGSAESGSEGFSDLQIDPARPHPGLRAFLGVASNQRRSRANFVQVLANRGDLRKEATIVQFECRQLAAGIPAEVGSLTIFASHEIDLYLGHVHALFGQKNMDDLRIGPKTGIQFHRFYPL
jgi:hypothetical protein